MSLPNYKKTDFESPDSPDITDDHLRTHTRICDVLSGYLTFQPHLWQTAVSHELLSGKDVLLKAGTGSGKTLTFQAVSKLVPEKIVMVVSPLNALMGDQVERATSLGITSASLTAESMDKDPKLLDDVSLPSDILEVLTC